MKIKLPVRSRQRGISLVEMSIGAVIVAMLLVGGLMALKKVQFDRQMHEARQSMPNTLAVITSSAASQQSTAGINTQMVSLLGAWPAERVKNPGKSDVRVQGPFPGSGEQVFGTSSTQAPRFRVAYQGFNYWITNIPPQACIPMLQLLAVHSNVAALSVGEATAVVPGIWSRAGNNQLMVYASNGQPSLSINAATQACSGDTNKNISVLIART